MNVTSKYAWGEKRGVETITNESTHIEFKEIEEWSLLITFSFF